MFTWIRHILTGADNSTFCVGRVFAAFTGIGGVFLHGWSTVVNHVPFDMQQYGIGVGALAGGVGALLKLKEGSEPVAKGSETSQDATK